MLKTKPLALFEIFPESLRQSVFAKHCLNTGAVVRRCPSE